MTRVGFVLISVFFTLHAWAVDVDSINFCPQLAPEFFSRVVYDVPGADCSHIEQGPGGLIKRIQRFLPAGRSVPDVALVLRSKDSNAFYSSYALNVPVLLLSKDLLNGNQPVSLEWGQKSGAIATAHEYGHAILSTWLSDQRAEFADMLSLLRRLGRTRILLQLLPLRDAFERDEIQRRLGNTAEAQRELTALESRSSKESRVFTDRVLEYRSRLTPYVGLDSFQTGYQEVFADLVAVLFADNWRAMAYAIDAVSNDPWIIFGRDFTSPRNELSRWVEMYEDHLMFAPVRYFIWKRLYQDRHCVNLRKEMLLNVVFESILRQYDQWKESNFLSVSPKEANRRWIRDLEQALSSENLEHICPRY